MRSSNPCPSPLVGEGGAPASAILQTRIGAPGEGANLALEAAVAPSQLSQPVIPREHRGTRDAREGDPFGESKAQSVTTPYRPPASPLSPWAGPHPEPVEGDPA